MKNIVLSALKSVLKSRLFIVIISLWLVFTILIGIASQNAYSFAYYYNGQLPNYQNTVITELNGTNLTVYSQTFNQFGQGAGGSFVHYSLILMPNETVQEQQTVSEGFAGATDNTGYVNYNISGILGNNFYFLKESVSIAGTSLIINSTTSINFVGSQSGVPNPFSEKTISVTPVVDQADPSVYSLHIWKPKSVESDEISISYEAYPSLTAFPNGPLPNRLATINITYEENVPTPFLVHGNLYYYWVNINYQSGELAGASLFTPLKTPSIESAHSLNFVFGISAIFIFLEAIVLASLLGTAEKPIVLGKQRKALSVAAEFLSSPKRSEMFKNSVITTTLSFVPMVLITAALGSLFSLLAYRQAPPISDIIAYSLSSMLIGAIGASFTYIGLLTRFRPLFVKNEKGDKRTKWSGRLLWSIVFVWQYYFMILNLNGFIYPLIYNNSKDLTLNLIVSNIVNPSSYMWLVGEFISGNLFFVGTYSFVPSAFGLSLLLILVVGAIWFLIAVLLPFLLFRRTDLKH